MRKAQLWCMSQIVRSMACIRGSIVNMHQNFQLHMELITIRNLLSPVLSHVSIFAMVTWKSSKVLSLLIDLVGAPLWVCCAKWCKLILEFMKAMRVSIAAEQVCAWIQSYMLLNCIRNAELLHTSSVSSSGIQSVMTLQNPTCESHWSCDRMLPASIRLQVLLPRGSRSCAWNDTICNPIILSHSL